MGNFPDPSPDAVRIPPTQPPKRKKQRPRWVQPVAFVVVVALTAVALSALLNREVSKRLATVPPPTSLTTTTAVVTVPPTTPTTTAQVLGARVTRPAPQMATTSTTEAPPPETQFEAATPSELIASLEKLPVEQEHRQNYRRSQFGFYRDADGDGCETRLEVAIAEAISIQTNPQNCDIQSGKWYSPFDAKTSTNVDELDVVHLVSLQETWESGAWRWTDAKRNEYLNDLAHPETMLVVTTASNQQRADEDPAGWMPPNEDYLCDYLKAWVYLKTLYKLSVDAGERETIAAAATGC